MSAVQGVITEINVKALDAPDQWGNTHRRGFKVAAYPTTLFSCGAGKKAAITVKEGKGFYDLKVGDEVQFFYEVNGDYFNVKSSKIAVVAKAVASAAAPLPAPVAPTAAVPVPGAPTPALVPSPAPQRPAGAPVGGFDSRVKDIKVGRAVNIAAELFAAKLVGSLEDGLKEAVRLEVLADKYYTALYARAEATLAASTVVAAPSAGSVPVAPAVVAAPAAPAVAVAPPVLAPALPPPAPTIPNPPVHVPVPAAALVVPAATAAGVLALPPSDDGFNDDIPF